MPPALRKLKAMGFSDKRLAYLALQSANVCKRHGPRAGAADRGLIHDAMQGDDRRRDREAEVRALRHKLGVRPVFKRIDTCAAEFEAKTPYMYSTYEAPMFGAPEARRSRATGARSSSWAAGRTGSGRASSSIIAAATPASRWRMRATRRS